MKLISSKTSKQVPIYVGRNMKGKVTDRIVMGKKNVAYPKSQQKKSQ